MDAGSAPPQPSQQHFQQAYLAMLEQQRTLLQDLNQQADFDEDIIRKHLAILDLEEYRLREKQRPTTEAG